MNPIDLLIQDHRRVEELFSDFMSAEPGDRQEELFQSIETELLAHGEAEEQVFYPALKNEAPEKVDQAVRDHSEMKRMLLDLLDANFDDEEFDNRFTELMDIVQHHVTEEEAPDGIMEIARRTLSAEQLSKMPGQIERVKRSVQSDMAA